MSNWGRACEVVLVVFFLHQCQHQHQHQCQHLYQCLSLGFYPAWKEIEVSNEALKTNPPGHLVIHPPTIIISIRQRITITKITSISIGNSKASKTNPPGHLVIHPPTIIIIIRPSKNNNNKNNININWQYQSIKDKPYWSSNHSSSSYGFLVVKSWN